MNKNHNIKIAPSILSADFGRLSEEIKAVEGAGADVIHVDVMDGRFVPNITIGPLVVRAVREATTLPVDCHLMITQPDRYVEAFKEAGADWVSVHLEAEIHLHRTISLIKGLGLKAGVAINPATPVALLADIIQELDYCLIMTVNPGFGGQRYIDFCANKIKELNRLIKERGLNLPIQVDGGINEDTIKGAVSNGARIIVAGSSIFGKDNYNAQITLLRQRAG